MERNGVTSSALQVCVRAIRAALGDEAGTPRYIATVGREGYRFIGQVISSQYPVVNRKTTEPGSQESKARILSFPSQHSALSSQSSVLVGRDTDLAQLHTLLDKALQGERQLIFVTGEAGIGKTTLVDTFLAQIHQETRSWKLGAGSPLQ